MHAKGIKNSELHHGLLENNERFFVVLIIYVYIDRWIVEE